MGFKQAVLATEALSDAYRPGLQALRNVDHAKIQCADPRSLTGSVNLDEALSQSHPNDPRWDYGIGLRKRGRSEHVIWIEVHPASSRHVQEVLSKLSWLRQWLVSSAPLLSRIPAAYVWLASGKVALSRGSPQRRRLAAAGIHFAGRRYGL
jgi:hypothetical protein